MPAEKPVRVAIITSNYWPERTGIGQVTTEFAEYLASEGISVRVATAMPYYPEWSIYPAYQGRLWKTELHNRVSIYHATHYARPSPTTFGRILHEATLCLLSIPNMVRALSGAVRSFVVSPDLSHAFVGCVVSRLMGVRPTLIVQDVMPDAAVEMGMLSNKFVIQLSRLLARANYTMAETIYTLSEGMKARIAHLLGASEKIEIVPNTIDCEELAPGPNQGKAFRDRFVPPGKFAVVHTGNMGEKQDLELLLRAARSLADCPNIHFYVFGDGAAKKDFLRVKEAWGLSNVSHFPLQDRSMLPHMLFGADVCLISQLPEVIDFVVPSKLVTAMGSGAMIIAACSPDSEPARIIAESRAGIVVRPSDEAALAAALMDTMQGNYDVSGSRRRARAYARIQFDRSEIYGRISKRLIAENHGPTL